MTEPTEDKINALRSFLEDMKDDASTIYNDTDRMIDNSCSTSREYYIKAREENEKEFADRLTAIEKIEELFGVV